MPSSILEASARQQPPERLETAGRNRIASAKSRDGTLTMVDTAIVMVIAGPKRGEGNNCPDFDH